MKDDDAPRPYVNQYIRDDFGRTPLEAVAGVNITTDDDVAQCFDRFHVSDAKAKPRKPEIFLVGRRVFF